MANVISYWDALPKWLKVVPYVALSGALAALVKYLAEVEVSDALLMGVINVVIVLLKGASNSLRKK